MDQNLRRPEASIFLGVALTAASALAFELALTRIFAAMWQYHYAFLAISLAVCGMGIGSLLCGLRHRIKFTPAGNLIAIAWLLALSIFALLLVADSKSNIAVLAAIGIPFVFFAVAGMYLATAFGDHGDFSGWLYAADLASAGLAALGGILLLDQLGPLRAVLALGAAFGLAGMVQGHGSRLVIWLNAGAIAACALLWPKAGNPPLFQQARWGHKPLGQLAADRSLDAKALATRWDSFARTDLVELRIGDQPPRYFFIDGDVPTRMERWRGDLREAALLKAEIAYLPFCLEPRQTVLSLGPGGGRDVLMALLAGCQRIVAVEVNKALLALMSEHRAYHGDLYARPEVELHIAEGRHFIQRSKEKFDLILCALTQTATVETKGMALAESYIHTSEAFAAYWQHLTANGRFALVVQEEPLLWRAVATAAALHQAWGTSTSCYKHLFAASLPEILHAAGPYRHIFLWNRAPFTLRQCQRLQQVAEQRGLEIRLAPWLKPPEEIAPLLGNDNERNAACAAWQHRDAVLDIRPATDQRPFFLDLSVSTPKAIKYLAYGSGALAILFAILAALRYRGAAHQGVGLAGRLSAAGVILGIAFMLIEIPLVQRFVLFVGHPTLSVALVVAAILVSGGLGSCYVQRYLPEAICSLLRRAAIGVPLFTAIVFWIGINFLPNCLACPLGLRAAYAALSLLPLGFFLGMPFPLVMRLASQRHANLIPWLWGINGVASVAGSTLAAIMAKIWGFDAALLAGSLGYLLIIPLFIHRTR